MEQQTDASGVNVTLEDTSYFENSEKQKIFCKEWKLDQGWTPQALVFIAHGAKEHCLWYGGLSGYLVKKGCLVFAHDHVGHGQSEGDRVHLDQFSTYTNDVFQHCDMKKKEFPGLPLFIIGHSMGGAIAVMSAMERPSYFNGVILIAAAVVASPDALSPFKYYVGKLAARVCPQLQVIHLDKNAISRDTEVVTKYENDPLVWQGGLKAKWGLCMLDAMTHIQANMEKIEWPVLILHGDEDKICDISGSKELNERIKSTDKTLKIYEGFYHQLHSEPDEDGKRVMTDIQNWIAERIK